MHESLTPNPNDVLISSSNEYNRHPGNINFRAFVSSKREDFSKASDSEKQLLVSQVYAKIQNSDPPGRFLTKISHYWYDLSIISNGIEIVPARGQHKNEDNLYTKTDFTQSNKGVNPKHNNHFNKSFDWTPLKLNEGKELDGEIFGQSMVDVLNGLNKSIRRMDINTENCDTSSKDYSMDFSSATLGKYSIQDQLNHATGNFEAKGNENPLQGNERSINAPRSQMETRDEPWRTSSASSYTFPPLTIEIEGDENPLQGNGRRTSSAPSYTFLPGTAPSPPQFHQHE